MITLPDSYRHDMSIEAAAALLLGLVRTPLRTRQRHPLRTPEVTGTHELQLELSAAGIERQRAIEIGRVMAREFTRKARADHRRSHGPAARQRAMLAMKAPAAVAPADEVNEGADAPGQPVEPVVTLRAVRAGSADVVVVGGFVGEVERRPITIEQYHENDGRPFGSTWRSWRTVQRWQWRRDSTLSEDQGWFGAFATRRDAVSALVSE